MLWKQVQETPRVELRTTRLLVYFTKHLFICMCVGVWGMILYLDGYQIYQIRIGTSDSLDLELTDIWLGPVRRKNKT